MDPVAERIRSQVMELSARWEARARELPELQHMSQPVLFDLREDIRPPSQQTASGRYAEPSLLDGIAIHAAADIPP